MGGLGDGGRCAMWVKNRDYRLRRRRRGRWAARVASGSQQDIPSVGSAAGGCWGFRAFGGGDKKEILEERFKT